jgi:hypothetical protein
MSTRFYFCDGGLKMEQKLYKDSEIIAKGLSYGLAFDAMMYSGRRITREAWGGWWQVEETENMGKVIVAYLKDGKTKAPAQPYQGDMMAHDWIILGDKKECEKEKYHELDIFECMKLKDDVAEMVKRFMEKYEGKVIKPYTKSEIDSDYNLLMETLTARARYPSEMKLIQVLLDQIISAYYRQMNAIVR